MLFPPSDSNNQQGPRIFHADFPMTYYEKMMAESASYSRMNLIVGLAFLAVGLFLAFTVSGFFLHGIAALCVLYGILTLKISHKYRQLANRYKSRILNR